MSVFQWLVLISIIGSVLIVAGPSVHNHFWNCAYNAGFKAGKDIISSWYPVRYYDIYCFFYSSAYDLGYRHGLAAHREF